VTSELKVVTDATRTFCGCVCDDMELTVEGHEITKAKNACVLGKAWFLNPSDEMILKAIEKRIRELQGAVPASNDHD
jgi:formylmethanofuran dehydrogenase subunit B